MLGRKEEGRGKWHTLLKACFGERNCIYRETKKRAGRQARSRCCARALRPAACGPQGAAERGGVGPGAAGCGPRAARGQCGLGGARGGGCGAAAPTGSALETSSPSSGASTPSSGADRDLDVATRCRVRWLRRGHPEARSASDPGRRRTAWAGTGRRRWDRAVARPPPGPWPARPGWAAALAGASPAR